MKRILGHIALLALCLCGAVFAHAAESPRNRSLADAGKSAVTEVVCSTEVQGEAMRQIIHDSLRSDNLPATPGVNGTRTVVPVFRINPHLKFLTEAMPAMLRESSAPTLQYCVQDLLSSHFRAALDASGYYVFALRKIII